MCVCFRVGEREKERGSERARARDERKRRCESRTGGDESGKDPNRCYGGRGDLRNGYFYADKKGKQEGEWVISSSRAWSVRSMKTVGRGVFLAQSGEK